MSSELTQIIAAAKDDSSKSAEAFALLAGELRNLAASKMRNLPPSHTLQPTALVNEAFIRLMNRDASWESRGQFFMFAARAMRDILVEHARRRAALKRGGDFERIQLDALSKLCGETDHERILSLHNALSRLEVEDDRAATIVHLRFFAGLAEDDIARVLGVSTRTVRREWAFARTWIHREMSAKDAPDAL